MMNSKTFHDIKTSMLFPPDAEAADNVAVVSAIIDTANFTSCTLVGLTGTMEDAAATWAILVEDGDDASLSDNAAVADVFLVGTEAGVALDQADDDTWFKIGYIGPKRYVRMTVTPSDNGTAWALGGVALLGGSRKPPHTTQTGTD